MKRERVEALWREALNKGWTYARYCKEYRKMKCKGCPYKLANNECALSEFPDVGCAREGIEYLTHDEHVKKHGGRPQWLIGSNGSWKRDRKRHRMREALQTWSWKWKRNGLRIQRRRTKTLAHKAK